MDATVKHGIWTCPIPKREKMLNSLQRAHYRQTGADPNQDGTAADMMAERLKGTVIYCDETEYDPNVVY